MKTLGNILWFVLVGFWAMLAWLTYALLLCLPIVTIPFARQCLKLARFSAWPFGREAVASPNASQFGAIGQVIWIIFAGIWLAITYLVGGILLCCTIVGIPFGLQSFKLAGLALAPFGKEIVTTGELRSALADAG